MLSLARRWINPRQEFFFSLKNVNHIVATQISEALGVSIIANLDKYFGTPLLHKKGYSSTYECSMEKSNKCLCKPPCF